MNEYTIEEYYSGRKRWAVYAPDGEMLCVCLYKKGAVYLTAYLNTLTKEKTDEDKLQTAEVRG